jgi:hypothetical protein
VTRARLVLAIVGACGVAVVAIGAAGCNYDFNVFEPVRPDPASDAASDDDASDATDASDAR